MNINNSYIFMNNNALSVANYLIDLAEKSGKHLQPLKLMKLVYIAYGFGLAVLDRSIIDPRFDKVEAWRFGTVIPSVYHSFKQYGKNDITDKTTMIVERDSDIQIITPQLEDKYAKAVCEMVWRNYGSKSGYELVNILHAEGTPWWSVYVKGCNNPIPEETTKRYYALLYKNTLAAKNK